MDTRKCDLSMLFETSWEVCNKIGGIYTVLSTKAKTLSKLYGDKIIFIGPDVWDAEHQSPYFIPRPTLLKDWLSNAQLPKGVSVRAGRWNIPGKPIVLLVKFQGMLDVKNEFYGEMWSRFGVDSLHAYGDYDEGCAFAHASGAVIESYCNYIGTEGKRIVAHFDEWTTAMGLLYLKWKMPQIATVFTTHATCIGRSICGNNKPLYDYLKGYNGDQMAYELNMEAKHSLEKTAAHQADCFTTVSEITARECEQLLEIRPQVVTPNGFEGDFVPSRIKYAAARDAARKRLLDVASALTGKRYNDDTFILATSGRCEYRNKGIDMFIDSMRLLSEMKPKGKVLAFIMVPAWSKAPRADLATRLKQKTRTPLPTPIITHELYNPDQDAIYNRLQSIGLDNTGHTRVDVIYVPCYLNGCDGIFDMTYYDLIIGMDATVFPSYYEPWGYTPLESVAFGVPTITTSLSGFGRWISDNFDSGFSSCGVSVVNRTDSNYETAASSIAQAIKSLTADSSVKHNTFAKAAMTSAKAASWSNFINNYTIAYDTALEKVAVPTKSSDNTTI